MGEYSSVKVGDTLFYRTPLTILYFRGSKVLLSTKTAWGNSKLPGMGEFSIRFDSDGDREARIGRARARASIEICSSIQAVMFIDVWYAICFVDSRVPLSRLHVD